MRSICTIRRRLPIPILLVVVVGVFDGDSCLKVVFEKNLIVVSQAFFGEEKFTIISIITGVSICCDKIKIRLVRCSGSFSIRFMNTATHQRCPCEWGMGGMGYGVKKVKGLEFGVLQNTVASADCITGGVQLAEDWERREARGEGCCGRERLPTYRGMYVQ